MNRDEESTLSKIWKRRSDDLERTLRAARQEPRAEFVSALTDRVGETRPRRGAAFRLAFAGGLTVVMLVALAAVGGVSYAANAAVGAARTVQKVVTPLSAEQAIVVKGLSAGGDQYQPGYGWGDDDHNHDGPPAIRRDDDKNGKLRGKKDPKDGRFVSVSTAISVDEQVQLTVSVEAPGGKELLISQRRSTVGKGVDGPSTKNVRYSVLVPRDEIPIKLSIPKNLLRPGVTYFIVVRAVDPDGEVKTIRIPFRL
jgi:hypothetical protein